jgi:hypothetical protein
MVAEPNTTAAIVREGVLATDQDNASGHGTGPRPRPRWHGCPDAGVPRSGAAAGQSLGHNQGEPEPITVWTVHTLFHMRRPHLGWHPPG